MTLVSVTPGPDVATIIMDDGKVNVLSPAMLTEIDRALDDAEAAGLAVVLAGRPGVFSAGFDLAVLRAADAQARGMLTAGFRLAHRLLSFPRPVVAACPGHAIAMASFLLLSCDYRIGANGAFRITANEVALGLTMPRAAVEICRQRLTPAHFNRAVILAEVFGPDAAVTAGFLDRLTDADDVVPAAVEAARALAALDRRAHAETKLRARAESLSALVAAFAADDVDLSTMVDAAGRG